MIESVNILTMIILFAVYVIFDILYGWYIIAVQKLNAGLATILSIMIGVVSAVGIVKLADNPIYSVPIVLGGGLGTYFIIKLEKRKRAKEEQKNDVKNND